jgi:MFS family permease
MAAQTPIEQFEQNRASSSPLTGRLDHPVLTTVIPARSERLSWGRFHTLVVVALGTTWIVHGLEVTLAGSVAGALKASPALNFSDLDVGVAGSAYLLGAVTGALFFGWLTDRLGRKNSSSLLSWSIYRRRH